MNKVPFMNHCFRHRLFIPNPYEFPVDSKLVQPIYTKKNEYISNGDKGLLILFLHSVFRTHAYGLDKTNHSQPKRNHADVYISL